MPANDNEGTMPNTYLDLDADEFAAGRTLNEIAQDPTPQEVSAIGSAVFDMSGQRRAAMEIARSADPALTAYKASLRKAYDDDLALDEIEQLAVLYKAVELAKLAVPDSDLQFDLAMGFIAGMTAGYKGAGKASELAKTF